MQALGLEDHGGAVRAGFLHYSTPAEADQLLGELAALSDARTARSARA
jgi:selenocysteine lyase/cysteine desulfurase